MKLRTLVPVTYNNGIVSQTSGIVTMELGSVAYTNDFANIGVNYTYTAEDGAQIKSDAFFVNGEEEINNLFLLISQNLPNFTTEVEYTRAKFLEGAKYQMALTYGIPVTDIEII